MNMNILAFLFFINKISQSNNSETLASREIGGSLLFNLIFALGSIEDA